jgi:hypothetical protein
MKVKGKHLRGRPRSRWEQRVRKDVTQREGRPWKKLRRMSSGKTVTDGEAWFSDDPPQVETS